MRRLFPVLLLAFLTFGMPRVAEAQVTVAPFLTSNPQFLDGSGSPLNSGCVFTYAAGTTTPLVTYSDSAGSTPNSNPVLLNSGGFPQAGGIWLTAAAYKFVVKTTGGSNCSTGSTITTTDGITWSTPLSTFSGITSTANVVINPATAATGGANQSSPTLCIQGFYFNVTSLTDQWCLSNVVGTGSSPTSTFTVAHSGSGGAATIFFPGNASVGGTLGAKCVNGVCDLVGAGAKCDGATDDRATIQALLNTAGVKTVTAPPGLVCLVGSNPGTGVLLTDPGVNIQGVSFKVGNSIGNYNAFIDVTGSPNGISFIGNTFDGNATNNAVNSDPLAANNHISLRIFGGSNITIQNNIVKNNNDTQTFDLNPCDNCKVIHNIWTNAGVGGTFDHDSSEIYLASSAVGIGGEVAGNIMTAAGLGVRTAIEVHQDSKTVVHNIVQSYRYCVITSAELATAKDMVISNNTCSNVYKGIYTWGLTQKYDGLSEIGNEITINRNGFWSSSADDSGILIQEATVNEIKNLTIVDNHIRFVPDTLAVNGQEGGIVMVSNGSPGFPITNVTIAGNTIDNSPCAGILIQNINNISALAIKNNTITNPGQNTNASTCFSTAFKTGISALLSAGNTINGSVVENNIITDNQVSPTMQVGVRWIGVSGDNSQTGMVMRGDLIRYSAAAPNTNAYVDINATCPEIHEIIPAWARNNGINSIVNSQFCPEGSTIYDPASGRLYTQTVSNATTFVSSEFASATPSTLHFVGDQVFNSAPATNGPCGWEAVATGTPAAFTSIPCALIGNKVFVTTDFTTANNTNLQAITGLSWTFPAVAASYSFHCSLLYSQATAAVADQFGIQAATNNPTNIAASALAYSSSSVSTLGTVPTLATTTATPLVTFTPSATTTVFNATLEGTLELAASANTVNIMVQTSAGADAVTVKRGSYCQLW